MLKFISVPSSDTEMMAHSHVDGGQILGLLVVHDQGGVGGFEVVFPFSYELDPHLGVEHIDKVKSSHNKECAKHNESNNRSNRIEVSVWIWTQLTLETLLAGLLLHVCVVIIGVLSLSLNSVVSAFQPLSLLSFWGDRLLSAPLAAPESVSPSLLSFLFSFIFGKFSFAIVLNVSVGSPNLYSVVEFNFFDMVVEFVTLFDVLSKAVIDRILNLVIDRNMLRLQHVINLCL